MLLSTYNPECQATCPKCGFVKCSCIGGNLISHCDKNPDTYHNACGTTWRYYIDKSKKESTY